MARKYRIKSTNQYNYWALQFHSNRRIWSDSDPNRLKCLEYARIKQGNVFKFRCAQCGIYFIYNDVAVDHIIPIGISHPQTEEQYYICLKRLLVHWSKLQVLCNADHTIKTNLESEQRRQQYAAAC